VFPARHTSSQPGAVVRGRFRAGSEYSAFDNVPGAALWILSDVFRSRMRCPWARGFGSLSLLVAPPYDSYQL
jgi:hypothetical protein